MRAISIQQPWAWLIVAGRKDIENRTWSTRHRGRVLVHAGKRYDKDAEDWDRVRDIVRQAGEPLMMGGIIGSIEIVDCVTRHDSEWFFGPYGFVLANPQPLPFRPVKGALGIFDVPDA